MVATLLATRDGWCARAMSTPVLRHVTLNKLHQIVIAGWLDLYNAVNRLKFVLPVERKDEAEMLMAVLDKENAGQGPGYKMLGIVVRPSMLWTLAGGLFSVVAGAGMSIMIDMQVDTTSTGSLSA